MTSKSPHTHRSVTEEHLKAVRIGPGANCSSIGSVVDTLFVTGVAATALFAGVLAALKTEDIRVVGGNADDLNGPPEPPVTPPAAAPTAPPSDEATR